MVADITLKSLTFPGLVDTYVIPQIDNTLTESGYSADAKVVGDAIRETSDISKYTNKVERINMTPGAYVKTNIASGAHVTLTPVENESTEYAIINCVEGDVFCITARGITPGVACAFVDANDNIISRSEEARIYNGTIIAAPPNSSKLVINNYTADEVERVSYKGAPTGYFKPETNFTLTNGYYITYADGTTGTSSNMSVTSYIPAVAQQKYYVGFPRFYGNSCIGFYNERRQYIGYYGYGEADGGVEFITPANTAYVRITTRLGMMPTIGRLITTETLYDDVNTITAKEATKNYTGNPLKIEGASDSYLTISATGTNANTTVTACAKNIFDIPETKTITKNNVTFSYDADNKTITVTSTGATGDTVSGVSGAVGSKTLLRDFTWRFKTGQLVTITSNADQPIVYPRNVYLQVAEEDDTSIYNEDGRGYTRYCKPETSYYVRLCVKTGWSGTITFKPQIEISDYATPFEPYHGLTVAATTTNLKALSTYKGITNIFSNDNATLYATINPETKDEKIDTAYSIAQSALKLVPFVDEAFKKIDDVGAQICFIDDDTSNLAYVQRYHDLFEETGTVGNYAVIAHRLDDQTGLLDELLEYEIEGFGMLFHCYDQYTQGSGNTTYFLPENRNVVEAQRNILRGLRRFQTAGFSNYKYWVTPYGVNDAEIQSIAKKCGLNCLIATGNYGIVTRSSADKWNIPRFGFAKDGSNVNHLKMMVDACVEAKGLMIVTTHVNKWDDQTAASDIDDIFKSFLEYVVSKDISVVSFPEAFETRRAMFDLNSLM